MPQSIRLIAQPTEETGRVRFQLEFSISEDAPEDVCSAARLDTGDGHVFELGLICAPTLFNWCEQRVINLAVHAYAPGNDHVARVTWGEISAEVTVSSNALLQAAAAAPSAILTMGVRPLPTDPLQIELQASISGLASNQRVRLDGGAGQIEWISGRKATDQIVSLTLAYPKPGDYQLVASLLDEKGFWLATLVEQPVTVAAPNDLPTFAAEPMILEMSSLEAPLATSLANDQPWIPYRYARPAWSWARTYAGPGSTRVVRRVGLGTCLALKAETVVNDAVWYQTAGQDWIPANSLNLITPSALRGVELGKSAPPPPPPPPPSVRQGVVTATILNVRARPGVAANNPPVDRLREGAEVSIFEEQRLGDALWFRLGENRWAHSTYIRVLPTPATTRVAITDVDVRLPVGWVIAAAVSVRSGPGSSYPVVGEVQHNQRVDVLDTRTADGGTWYRIGSDAWVPATWIGVARGRARPAVIGVTERWVGVNLRTQTAVCYEGDQPVYAALVATGLPGTPTVQGIFRTWSRRPGGKMSGGRPGAGYYYLEEVVWTEYFYSGYALHSAYWHDAFGRPRSHGCVNLSMYDSWWIFNWSAAGGANSPTVYVYAA